MRVKSVEFDKYGAKIHVSGKTGDRSLRLTISVPLLAMWLSMHPRRDEPDAPLWPSRTGDRIGYQGLLTMVWRNTKKAGIKTRVYPHLFRHSRATFLASYLTEAQLCARFGWIQGSEQPGTYVHLSGKDADDAILAIYGIKKEESGKAQLLMPKQCSSCGFANAFNAMSCGKCGSGLSADPTSGIAGTHRL